MSGDTHYQLLVHKLCPWAERAMLVASYKGILDEMNITECDLVNKPDILVQNNPLGAVPTLIITQGDRVTSLYETIVITNFIARLHGREIYPFNTDPVDELEIASLNTFLLTKTDQFFRAQYQMRSGSITNEQIEEIRNNLRQINALLGDSQFFGKAAIGIDEVSLADIHLFPSIERIIYINKLFCDDVLNGEVPQLEAWFERMLQFDWVQAVAPLKQRYVNLARKANRGEHRGLEMPLTNYDQQFKIIQLNNVVEQNQMQKYNIL